jgi:DNA-binding IscR family transcriptional regulator
VTDEHNIVQAMGTVAHNRRFTSAELASYAGVPPEMARAVIRKWKKDGLLEYCLGHQGGGPFTYFPTPAGWAIIEAACE